MGRRLVKPMAVDLRARAPGARSGRSRWLRRCALAAVLLGLVLPVVLVLPLRWIDPPTTAFMLAYRWSAGSAPEYRWADWERISPWMKLAAVAAEDQKFVEHFGFDLASIADAIEERDEGLRGASTISQQTVKNLYLWSGRSFLRKGLEAYLTLYVEALWPKRRILEVYVNVAELGHGVYGVEAASRRFYRKAGAQLTAHEAALLAAVLPNPRALSARAPSAQVRRRAAWIERQMRQLGGPAYLSSL